MNDNFEQQFVNNIQQNPNPQAVMSPTNNLQQNIPTDTPTSKLPWIIVAGLSVVILVLIIIIVIMAINNNSGSDDSEDIDDTEAMIEEEEEEEDSDAIYDEEGLLSSFNSTCSQEDGSKFSFSTDGTYTSSNKTGTYSMVNGNVIVLDGDSANTLYYDSFTIADGITIYYCDIDKTEESE